MSTAGTLYDETVKYGFARLITAQDASNSASLNFVAGLEDESYDAYFFELDNLVCGTDQKVFSARLSNNAGASWVASNYLYSQHSIFANSAPPERHYGSQIVAGYWLTQFALAHAVPIYHSTGGRFRLFNGPASSLYRNCTWQVSNYYSNSLGFNTNVGGGYNGSITSRVTGVQFFYDGGVIYQGSVRMFGMKRA